jgi:hypothetical protein
MSTEPTLPGIALGIDDIKALLAGPPSVNTAPVATPGFYTTYVNSVIVMLLEGVDPEGDTLTVTIVSQPAHGTLTAPYLPFCAYLPDFDYLGMDSFAFTVSDGGFISDPAFVTIEVIPWDTNAPIPDPLTLELDMDTDISFTLTATEPEGDPMIFFIDTGPSNGTLSGDPPNLVYTPDQGYLGQDNFIFRVRDLYGNTSGNCLVVLNINDPTPPLGPPLWHVTHENGNLNQWDGQSNSGAAGTQVSDERAHTGQYSAALTVGPNAANGDGTRLRQTGELWGMASDNPENLPTEGYYGAWYFIPQFVDGNNNIFQWKQAEQDAPDHQTRRMAYNLSFRSPDMHLETKTYVAEDGSFTGNPGIVLGVSATTLPVSEWFHIEAYYRWSTEPDGEIIFWLNGEEVFHIQNRRTQFVNMPWLNYIRQWAVNNYANSDQVPGTHTIFIDDAIVSESRIWTG